MHRIYKLHSEVNVTTSTCLALGYILARCFKKYFGILHQLIYNIAYLLLRYVPYLNERILTRICIQCSLMWTNETLQVIQDYKLDERSDERQIFSSDPPPSIVKMGVMGAINTAQPT